MDRPYLSRSGQKPGKASTLLKLAAEKNAAFMRTKAVEEHREAQQKLAALRPILPNLIIQEELCRGVPCEWLYTGDAPVNYVILYLHGGSWAYGDRGTARSMGAMLAELSGLRVLVAEYRLSPEHPFPAGLGDCCAVFRWLREEQGYPAENIALMGDSAGGNLSLSLMHRLRAEKQPLPACAALASPVTDLRESSPLLRSGDDLLFTVYNGEETNIFSLYLGEYANREDPLISPILGNMEGFPPLLLHTGGDEPLAEENAEFARLAWEQGVDVHLKLWDGMFHDFTIVGVTLRESRQSVGEICAFIRRCLCL